jgi:DNA-binding transcriptional LysR family regulator
VRSTASAINRTLAVAGLGVTMAFDAYVGDALARGELVRVPDRFCEPFPGCYPYYPQRRHASRALQALAEHPRRARPRGRATRR